MTLQPRQQALLAALIERYVETAEPVGSTALVGDARFVERAGTVSSATVRNELAELEALGLVAQPHTSAGRVPTDAGYRLYVTEMLRPRAVRPVERRRIERGIAAPATSVEDALREACVALAQLTGYPAVATLPGASRDTLRHLQINSLPPRRLILVLVTASGRVEHRLFEVEDGVPAERLATVVNFLNGALAGRTLASLRQLSFETLSAGLHGAETVALAQRAFDWVQNSIPAETDERIVVQGLVTLLDEPEFSDIAPARAAMRLFEDEAAVAHLLLSPFEDNEYGRNPRYSIIVGSEYGAAGAAGNARFSLVGVAYGAGDETLGAVGVFGPTRMKYGEAAALLPALAARLQSSLESI
ncbi:MAG TPA: heat-inducible transcriptional repressor HrcA [Abditibacteriaceae bacterium]|jgi:heat-inducible transcriptional repressor